MLIFPSLPLVESIKWPLFHSHFLVRRTTHCNLTEASQCERTSGACPPDKSASDSQRARKTRQRVQGSTRSRCGLVANWKQQDAAAALPDANSTLVQQKLPSGGRFCEIRVCRWENDADICNKPTRRRWSGLVE